MDSSSYINIPLSSDLIKWNFDSFKQLLIWNNLFLPEDFEELFSNIDNLHLTIAYTRVGIFETDLLNKLKNVIIQVYTDYL